MMEDTRTSRAFTALNEASTAKLAFDLLGEDLDRDTRAVDHKAFALMEKGQLDPDMAIRLWYDKYATFKLLRKIAQKLQGGQSAARILEPMMEEPNG